MQLTFNDCQIRHDGLQYILTVKRVSQGEKTKGQEVESTLGYYPKESQLLAGLIKHGMGKDAVSTIESVKSLIEAATHKIEASRG